MLAFSLDNLFFLLLIAVAALFQLLSKAISKAGKSDSNKTSSAPTPQTPRPIQLLLPRFCLVPIFRLDRWRLYNRLSLSQAYCDHPGSTKENRTSIKEKAFHLNKRVVYRRSFHH